MGRRWAVLTRLQGRIVVLLNSPAIIPIPVCSFSYLTLVLPDLDFSQLFEGMMKIKA